VKSKFIISLAVAAGLLTVPCLAGVDQTRHNFTSATYSPNSFFWGTQETCVFCHAVHNASGGTLWNHETNGGQTYQMYTSNTMDMIQSATPHEGSLICLSCHDGTIAINSLNNLPGPEAAGAYGVPGGTGLDGTGRLTAGSHAFVGTNLSDDHPVGITYDQSRDLDFYPKTGNSQSYPDKLLSEGLYVECSSCHNPHNNTYSNFLIESNAGSALCTRCHIK
jgi:predicted CXXCH cytochrome family protein